MAKKVQLLKKGGVAKCMSKGGKVKMVKDMDKDGMKKGGKVPFKFKGK